MKVKVDGMSEKPANTAEAELSDMQDVCAAEDSELDCCTGGSDTLADGDKQTGAEKHVCMATDDVIAEDELLESDVEDVDLRWESKPEPPPRSDSQTHRTKGHITIDESLILETKPKPPPRSDSKRPTVRKRHMVDILGGYEMEETFSWDTQREYLLTCMGFVNGLGCLMKASTLIVKHGGGIFFIAYVICMILFGCPLVYLETTLGQYASGGPLTSWKVIPLFRGLGYCMVGTTIVISIYYVMEVTWALYYFGVAMSAAISGSKVPWDSSDMSGLFTNSVRTDLNVSLPPQEFSNSSRDILHSVHLQGAIKYFYDDVLQVPDIIGTVGSPVWYLVLCLLFAWVCVYVCLIYGPSSIGKVMYVTGPYPYIALPVLFTYSCFKNGSMDGIRFFLNPEWSRLATIEIWMDSAQLLLFTLSVGTGCLQTLAGYTHFHSHCFRNLVLICMCNVLGVMFAGLTVCAGLGILAQESNCSIINFTDFTEYELGYAVYPHILRHVTESSALAMLFFSIIIILGLDTLVIYVQTIVGAVTEKLLDCGIGCSRARRWLIQLVLCIVLMATGVLFTTKGGLYMVHFLDMYIYQLCPYMIVCLECCLLMYIFGGRKFVHNIEDMTGHKNSLWWLCNWKFLSPCILLALSVFSVTHPVKLYYRNLSYPGWCEILGWCVSLLPLLAIPVCAVKAIAVEPGTFTQRLKELLRTPHGWGAGLLTSQEHDTNAPDYVICQPDNHRPMHGLAMLAANLYVPSQLAPLTTEEVPPEIGSEMAGGYMSDLITITSADSIESASQNEGRGNWRGKVEFILSCLGYVVGLGNIWRFPYLVYRNGGGAFFIPYLIMLVFCGMPLVFMEMAFGQYGSLGPVTVWRAVPLLKGVGYAMVVSVSLISVYYNMVIAWAFHYLFSSFTSSLPWATCDNTWNTEACRLNKYQVTNCSLVNATYLDIPSVANDSCVDYLHDCIESNNQSQFVQENITACIDWLEEMFGDELFLPERNNVLANLKDPSEEYFYNNVLNASEGLQDIGPIQWQLALYLLMCWVIVFCCLVKGIYSAGKVAYIVVIIPIILLVVLLVCAMMVEGHLEGIRFYVTPKWDKMLTMKVWSDAASQVFFSLSACSGGLTTLSSYNKFHNNIYRDAILICLVDTLMSILSGFTVFASLGILAHQLDTTVDNVVTSNIGLVFVAIPAAVTHFQPSAMWSIFFFLMIVMMGMSSILVMTEITITVFMDEHVAIFRRSRIAILLVVCLVLYFLGLPFTTRGGSYLLQLLDEFIGGLPTVTIGLFMCLGLAWVYKIRTFCADIQLMVGRPVSWWWRAMWCCVSPLIMVFIIVSTIVGGVTLDTEHYPVWAEPMAIVLTILTVISIPIYAVKKLYCLEGPIMQRIQEACRPQDDWGPALVKNWKHVEFYPAVNTNTLSGDIEQSPVHAVAERVDFTTSSVQLPKLSQATLLSHNKQMSNKRPQELRQKAILNHAYSNPQCNMSNGSIDQIRPRLSLHEPSTDTLIVTPRKKLGTKTQDAATQTDTRSYIKALKSGSLKSLKEMRIETEPSPSGSSTVLQVEVTQF